MITEIYRMGQSVKKQAGTTGGRSCTEPAFPESQQEITSMSYGKIDK